MTAVHDKIASSEAPRIPSWVSTLRLVLGLYGFLGGAISFLGWVLDVQRLTDWINSGVSIQPNSAIAVTAAGAAILSLALGIRWLSLPLGALVAIIGVTAGFQLLTGIDLGINTLFMFGRGWGSAGAISPGQMGTPGFTSWSFIGVAIVLASITSSEKGRRVRTIAVTLAIITTAISTLSLTGFMYGATTLYTLPLLTVIAMQTATFVLALSVALIFCIADLGPARLLGEQSAAGLMARRVVPSIILVPILLGFVRLAGEKAGFYDLAFGTASRTLIEIALLLGLLALTARAVSRQTQRAEAQEMALRGLADAMPHVVWIADADGRVHYYNDRVSGWGGIVPTAGNTYDGHPSLHEEDREETQAVWQRAVSESHTYEREHRILMQDGTYRWHLSRATPVTTAAGKVWYGTATDIHEVKTAGQMIRESEQRFASFMQHLPGLAWIKDRFGRYVYVNEAAEKAFHFPQKDLYGKTDAEVFPPETAAAFAQNDQRALDSGAGIQVIETLKDDEGNPRESLVSKFPILGADTDGPLIGGMAIDITEQRKAQVNQDFLFTIAEMLRVGRNAEQLLADIADAVGKHLGAHRCFFNEIDIENDTGIVHTDYARLDRSLSGKYKLSDYRSSSTFDNMIAGQTVVNRDSKTDPRTADIFEAVYEPNKERSYITVPMLREGKWVASFWCSDDAPRDWTAPEIALLEGVAERTWTAVERLRTDALLRGREDMFSTLVEAAPFGVYFIDSQFRLSSINSGAKAVFAGIEPLIGRDFEEVLRIVWPEPFATDALQKFRHTLETGEPYYSITLSQDRSNVADAESYDWQLHRITLDDGRYGVVCYFYDLTKQIQLETAVRDSEERFRLAQQAGSVGIWDWDIAKGRTYWSEQMWTLYDESPRDTDPDIEFWNSHLHTDDRKGALDTFENTLDGGGEHHNDVYRIVRQDGSIRWIESIATVERDEAGKARRMYGVNLDITELQVAHDELEVRVVERTQELAKANTMLLQQMEERAFIEDQRIRLLKRLFTVQEDERGRIARDIHDHLGQRLTALRLKIASVRALCEGQELLEQRVNRLQEISEMLDKEVSFLAWELRPEILDQTDFVHALEQYVNEWSRHSDVFAEFTVIGLKDAELDKDIENNLYRITQEALNNAAKYAQAKQINVILEERAEELLLIIEDDGIGFDVAATSAESSSTKGFGLVGMRERASLIGGTIEIESAEEKGTTIFIRVPLAQENKG